jgi:hypothetical protein
LTPGITKNARRLWMLVASALLVAACGGATPSATAPGATPTAAATAAALASLSPATAGLATAGTATAAPATDVPATDAPPTSAPSTAEPITPAPPTSAPPETPPRSGPARVDLAFTKTYVFFADGTEGTCRLTKVDGVTRFWFEATAADYGPFGEHFTVKEVDGKVVIDWVIDATTFAYANNPNVVIKISANHRKVTLNQDLLPLTSSGGFTPGPEHAKGTITCS